MRNTIILWVAIAAVVALLFFAFRQEDAQVGAVEMPYSALLSSIEDGEIESAVLSGDQLVFITKRGDTNQYLAYIPRGTMAEMVTRLNDAGVVIMVRPPKSGPTLGDILLGILPMLLLIGAWYFFMRQIRGGGGGGKQPPLVD